MTALAYRRDIDGLRAVAVLSVLLCHFGATGFGGGYIGVDVFFVISGRLIAGLLDDGLERGSFSFAHFYERRVRRLFPALLALLAVVSVLALLLLLPQDLAQYGKSLAAAALFVSNIEFWREIGYFGADADAKPLLHTWSLAVEEQFYLTFPLLLWLIRKRSRAVRIGLLAAAAAASLALAQWAAHVHPNGAFFLAPTRAWELLAGGLLALARLPTPTPAAANVMGIGGLGMILAAAMLFSPETPVPGLAAILPCLGACLVIHSGESSRSLAGRWLGHRWLVAVGLISYSLYLWHWPLLVFGRYYALDGLGWIARLGLAAASFAAAVLSWRYLEQPIRKGVLLRRTLFMGGLGASGAAVALGVALFAFDGFPQRYGADIRALNAEAVQKTMTCAGVRLVSTRNEASCLLGRPAAAPDFVVWGDSHAASFSPALQEAALATGRSGVLASQGGCPPLIGVTRLHSADCAAFNAAQLRRALAPGVRDVFLIGRWAIYAEGSPYGDEPGAALVLTDGSHPRTQAGNHELFAKGLDETVRVLRAAGKRVVFVHSAPEVPVSLPQGMAKAKLLGIAFDPAPGLDDYLARQAFVMDTARSLGMRRGLVILYPHAVLCAGGRCRVSVGGRPFYRDHHHLTALGAGELTNLLTSSLRRQAQ